MKTISNCEAKKLSKPWITKDLQISIRIKNKLYASSDAHDKYKIYRNKICALTRIRKWQYYSKLFHKNLSNVKKMWEEINSLLAGKIKNVKSIGFIKDPNNNNAFTRVPKKIANVFASEYIANLSSEQVLFT